jgi:hypothetical protein
VVSLTSTTGLAPPIVADPLCDPKPADGVSPASGITFFGVTTQIALGVGQAMTVGGTMSLAAPTAQPATQLSISVCWAPAGSNLPVFGETQSGDFFGVPTLTALSLPAATNTLFTISRTFEEGTGPGQVAAGAYDVGLCGCVLADGTPNTEWLTDFSFLTVSVAQVTAP